MEIFYFGRGKVKLFRGNDDLFGAKAEWWPHLEKVEVRVKLPGWIARKFGNICQSFHGALTFFSGGLKNLLQQYCTEKFMF